MQALLIIGGYIIGAFITYLITQVICIYIEFEDVPVLFIPLIWPVALPVFLAILAGNAVWKKLESHHDDFVKRVKAFRDRPKTKKVFMDVPTSYRTSEKVMVTVPELDRHINEGLQQLGFERPIPPPPAKKKSRLTLPGSSESNGGPPG